MLFILHDEIYSTQPRMDIIGLIGSAAKSSRHLIVTEDPNSQAFSAWTDSLGSPLKTDIKEIFDFNFRALGTSRSRKTLKVRAAAPTPQQGTVSFIEATRLLRHPLSIYVENSRNDRAFLLSVCTQKQRETFLNLEHAREIQFIHGGGITELVMQLDSEKAIGTLVPECSFAIFDSDSLMPGRSSNQAASLRAKCASLGIAHHCLKRRAIENYLTKSALKNWAYSRSGNRHSAIFQNRTANFLAYIRMQPDFRQHYNMKTGLGGDKNRTDMPADIDLYESLTDEDKKDLNGGFGRDVASMFEDLAAEKELKSDNSWDELQFLISALEDHL